MKTFFALLILFLSCIEICGQPSNRGLSISRLSENVYVYTTYKNLDGVPFPSNSMYVVTNQGAILLDTPWDTTQFQPLLDSIEKRHGQKVVLCIATHFHEDRTAGLNFFRQKGISTYSSRKTGELCRKRNMNQSEFFFEDDTVFSVGGYVIETYFPGEGHSPDNIVIWLTREKVLYGGCLVKSTENQSMGNIADANLASWPQTIRNLIKKYKRPSHVIPGHFGWTSNQGLQHTLMLLKDHKKKAGSTKRK